MSEGSNPASGGQVLGLDAGLRAAVGALARSTAATEGTVLLAGLLALLHRLTLADQLVVGVADRRPPGAERPVGNLTEKLPLRVDAGADVPFAQLVSRTAQALTRASAHSDLAAANYYVLSSPRACASRSSERCSARNGVRRFT